MTRPPEVQTPLEIAAAVAALYIIIGVFAAFTVFQEKVAVVVLMVVVSSIIVFHVSLWAAGRWLS